MYKQKTTNLNGSKEGTGYSCNEGRKSKLRKKDFKRLLKVPGEFVEKFFPALLRFYTKQQNLFFDNCILKFHDKCGTMKYFEFLHRK